MTLADVLGVNIHDMTGHTPAPWHKRAQDAVDATHDAAHKRAQDAVDAVRDAAREDETTHESDAERTARLLREGRY